MLRTSRFRRTPAGRLQWPGRRVAVLLALSTCLILGTVTVARSQIVDPRMPTTDGQVWCMAQSGDTLYVGGLFHTVGPASGSFVRIDPRTGVQLPNGPVVSGAVSAAAADGRGGWYIGGSLFSISGVPRLYAAHVRADGTLDAWDPGLDGAVTAFALAGERLYLGGDFSHVGGQLHSGIAAVDPTSGAVADWSPVVSGGVTGIFCRHGVVYLHGPGTVDGVSRYGNAAVDSVTGAVTAWRSPYGSGDHTTSMAVSDSAVFVGTLFYGMSAMDPVTGDVLPWSPAVGGGGVTSFAVTDSVLYFGGNFTSVNGQPRTRLAAINLHTGQLLPWNPTADTWVWSLGVVDSTVYAGGPFTSINGIARNGMAAVDATTGVLRPWNPAAVDPTGSMLGVSATSVAADGVFGPTQARPCENLAAVRLSTGEVLDWNPGTTGLAPEVICMAVGGGRLYVGGWFDTVGGLSRPEVASLDLATGRVTDWRPFPNTQVSSIAVRDSTVYIGGAFTAVGGVPRTYVAAVNARTGQPTPWNPSADNLVRSMVLRDSILYCGGYFGSIGGQTRAKAAALSLTTGRATAWNPSCDQDVLDVLLTPTNAWLVGEFSSVGGTAHTGVAQVDLASGAPTPWAGGVSSGIAVWGVASCASAVYVGGDFRLAADSTRNNLAAFDPTTGALLGWNAGPDGQVGTLMTEGDALLVGGEFSIIAGQSRTGLARLLPTETATPDVAVLGPVGDAELAIGATRRLAWNASDAVGVQSVDLYLSRTGPAGPWALLAAGAPNTGGWDWNVTGPPVNGTAWLLVVARNYSGRLGSAIGSSAFSITTNPLAVGPPQFASLSLSPPVPNPVRSRALIHFTLPRSGHVKLSLMDVQGRVASQLLDGEEQAGDHSLILEARGLQPGLYFARLQVPGAELDRRVVVVR